MTATSEWIRDGFPGQRMVVLPRPRVRDALLAPATSSLVVTDVGHFPRAFRHGRRRDTPVAQAIVMICVDGSGWVESHGKRHPVTRGQFVVVPPGVAHAYGADGDDPWTLWWLHVEGSLVRDWMNVTGFGTETAVRTLLDTGEAVSLIQQTLFRMGTDTTGSSMLAASGAAWHLLTLLAVKQVRTESTSEAIENAAAYLRQHYADPVSVADLASMSRLSVSHFSSLFRRQVGQSVQSYKIELRMARARELLDITTIPVAEVARGVGYDDAFYFARLFRKIHGVSPRSYRAHGKG